METEKLRTRLGSTPTVRGGKDGQEDWEASACEIQGKPEECGDCKRHVSRRKG